MKRVVSAVIMCLKKVKRALTRAAIHCCIFCFRLLPVQNRVFFYTIRANGTLLENLRCVYDACDGEKVVFAAMLPHSFFAGLHVRRLMLTSRVIVTDDYLKYCRDTTLRSGQKLVQLWHAPGAFKCFGLDAPSRLTPREERSTHAQYTDVCVSSEAVRRFYAGAFGVPLSVVKALGTPRTDALLNKQLCAERRSALLERRPQLKNKIIYLYAPTFRERNGAPLTFDSGLDFAALDRALQEDEIFVVTRHPVMQTPFFAEKAFARIVDLTDEPTGDLLCCASVLLTDYSSVLFDASLMGIPTVFYCPDRKTYERSFYLDFDRDLPGPVTEDAGNVLPLLRASAAAPDREMLLRFCERQTSACDGQATRRIAALIASYLS